MRNFWQKYHSEIGIVSALIMLLVVLACGLFSSVARAVDPGWYAPDDNGEGLIVRCGSGGCAMAWLTHGKDAEQIWLISTETCPRESAVCELQMSETTGLWRGLGGETEIADPTVEIEVRQTDDGVTIDWDARSLFPDQCFDIGSGGLLLRGCVGRKQFDLLAR